MQVVETISGLPNVPAVYALYGGRNSGRSVAYVGMADKLKQRITQHLIRRDSSVVTGAAVVSLNPELVTEMTWWEHPAFTDRICLEAAELVAFEMFQPTLRSRGARGKPGRGGATLRRYSFRHGDACAVLRRAHRDARHPNPAGYVGAN